MAVARVTTWAAGNTLTAAALNAEFDNVVGNGTDVAFPLTKNVSAGGFNITSLGNLTMSSGGAITMTAGLFKGAQGTTIASAATTNLAAATGNYVQISGTTTITAFGTVQAGTVMYVEFQDILTFTHNATSMILPGGANITTAAGDIAVMVSEGGGNWRCIGYQRASSLYLTATVTVGQGGTGQTSYTNGQLLIGNTTGNTLTKATLTAGSGVTVTNSTGSITVATVAPKIGSTTRDLTTATGVQGVTGVGFQPRMVEFEASVDNVTGYLSLGGCDDGTNAFCFTSRDVSANFQRTYQSASSIFLQGADGNSQAGKISVMQADGFTISWTKTGSPTGTATIIYKAYP